MAPTAATTLAIAIVIVAVSVPEAHAQTATDNAPFRVKFTVANLKGESKTGSFTVDVFPEWAPLGPLDAHTPVEWGPVSCR